MSVQQLVLFDDQTSPFERIKHIDEYGREFWIAREYMPVLDYSKWQNFEKVINRAQTACRESGGDVNKHFGLLTSVTQTGKGRQQEIIDYKLSRFACYLIAMNGDPSKKIIADAQTYFAEQTRRQELSAEQKLLKNQQDVTAYRLRGKSELDAISRVGAKQASKEQNAAIYRAHETNKPNFGRITDAQNQALFDMTKAQIVDYLGLLPKDADKYRDRLGRWANEAVRIAGKEITRQMELHNRELNDAEIVAIVVPISRRVTETARQMAELDRVDFLSGASLDDDGNPQLPRNIRLLPKG